MTFFFSPNTFLGVAKLHVFWRKKYDTLGDVLLTLQKCMAFWISKITLTVSEAHSPILIVVGCYCFTEIAR
jgi:hypothetical protein